MTSQQLRPGATTGSPMPSWLWVGMIALGAVQAGCGGASPTAPTPGALSATGIEDAAEPATVHDSGLGAPHVVQSSNRPPTLVLKTQPAAVPGSPYPVISGAAPLEVSFNLCPSSDPDQGPGGDSLNWQFHFGDDGSEAFNPDGTFNASFAGFCRTSHTYAEGTYVATVSVTDKHLEDQSGGVSSLARAVERVTVAVSGSDAPASKGGPGSLTTLFATNNSFAGNTFDLEASVPLQITGFDVNLDPAGGTHTIAVYYRTGTANGAESNPAGWILLGRDTGVVSAGQDSPSSVDVGGLTLTPGQVYGIYLEVESYPSASIQYTNGGPTAFSNGDLSLTTLHGKGNPAFTGASFFPRQWNGTVRYVK